MSLSHQYTLQTSHHSYKYSNSS